MAREDEVYLFTRNDAEAQRLDAQHNLLVSLCDGQLLDSSIPQDHVLSIADVGTGTGVWLREVSNTLQRSSGTGDSQTAHQTGYEYHGFDISPAHFPQEQDGFRFFQHDILKPFPSEFHGRYDVVNIRLLALALKKEQFKIAAENAAQLLKKGGSFQWLELDPASQSYHPAMPITTQIQSIMRTAGRANSISTTPSAEVQDAFTAIGLTDVVRKEYTAEGKPEVEEGLKGWVVGGAKSGLGNALVRGAREKGEDEEQARENARKLLSEFETAISSGETKVRMPVIVVIGRRAK